MQTTFEKIIIIILIIVTIGTNIKRDMVDGPIHVIVHVRSMQ